MVIRKVLLGYEEKPSGESLGRDVNIERRNGCKYGNNDGAYGLGK